MQRPASLDQLSVAEPDVRVDAVIDSEPVPEESSSWRERIAVGILYAGVAYLVLPYILRNQLFM